MTMRNLIYNFSGFPGDLYQLVPDKFLATLCAVLNRRDDGCAQVWDRGNLLDAQRLTPGATLRKAMRSTGGRVFKNLQQTGTVPKVAGAVFGAINSIAGRRGAGLTHEYMDTEAAAILELPVETVFLNMRHGSGFAETIRLADNLRKGNPTLRIIAIGHRASWFARPLAELYHAFDAFVIGPSSYDTMAALAEGADPAEISNVAFRRDGQVIVTKRDHAHSLDTGVIPSYAQSDYHGIEGQLPLRELVLANEACPFSCHFCVRPPTYGRRWNARKVLDVVDEIEFRVRQENIHCFRCSDSTPPPGMLTAMAEELINRGLHKENLHISSFGRANRNLRDNYATLRKAGFDSLFYGIESGSQRVLDEVLGKKLTVSEAKEAIIEAHYAGLSPVASFMFPIPGETQESRKETLDLLEQLQPYLAGALIQPSGIYPETPWHLQASEFGIRLDDDYINRAVTYPINPLKPIRFWPEFPFSYDLMGKPAQEVSFGDIVEAFTEFSSHVWGRPERGGLGIPNVQDYGIVLARYLDMDPVEFSLQCVKYMVTLDLATMADMFGDSITSDSPTATPKTTC